VEEGRGVKLVLLYLLSREAVLVCDEQVDLVLARGQPLDVTLALLVVFEALIRLAVACKPIAVVKNALGLENLLTVPSHVGCHWVFWEVVSRADSSKALLFVNYWFDTLVLLHARGVVL